MTKYQLIYNGNECFPLLKTKREAEKFKQKANEQYPLISVEIKAIELKEDES